LETMLGACYIMGVKPPPAKYRLQRQRDSSFTPEQPEAEPIQRALPRLPGLAMPVFGTIGAIGRLGILPCSRRSAGRGSPPRLIARALAGLLALALHLLHRRIGLTRSAEEAQEPYHGRNPSRNRARPWQDRASRIYASIQTRRHHWRDAAL